MQNTKYYYYKTYKTNSNLIMTIDNFSTTYLLS